MERGGEGSKRNGEETTRSNLVVGEDTARRRRRKAGRVIQEGSRRVRIVVRRRWSTSESGDDYAMQCLLPNRI